jgi:AcrR family transcriptional regulator
VSEQNTETAPPVELEPRRNPLQYRSKRTVAKILDATAELLDDEGSENLTTERVAERSGVNIATLYHYFPNKLALLHALAQQFADQQQERVDAIYCGRDDRDWRETVDLLVDTGFEFNRSVKGALAAARAMQSHAALREIDLQRDARQSEFVAQLLAELGVKGSPAELQTRALVLLQTAGNAMNAALMWYPERGDAVIDETKVMLKQYIEYYIEQPAGDTPCRDEKNAG